MGKGQELYKKAKKIIPGGTQLLSKRPEMFLPENWPAYYDKAKGCEIWDLDGNKYCDMSYMGIGACILGYADEDINTAVKNAIDKGSMTTLNAPEEEELANLLIELHPWAQMVRYARGGGDALAVAVRIARAHTTKDKILFCGYHGWHDWYLAANLADDKALDGHLIPGLSSSGVPRALKGTSFPFQYNDIETYLKLITEHGKDTAAVAMEPIRNHEPDKEFIKTIRETTEKLGIVLIIDEVTAGWRLNPGGAHLGYNIEPDIAVFGKGMSNGFPMAAIVGKNSIMEAAQGSFISSTYWTDRIGPTSAIATIKKFNELKVHEHLKDKGKKIQDGWSTLATKNNIDITIEGIYPLGHFTFNHKNSLELKTLFTQEMLKKGFLATTAYYASYAHKNEHIQAYLLAVDETFAFVFKAISDNNLDKYLEGPICHSGFSRLT